MTNVCLQRHTKVFRYITAYEEKCLKRILTYLYCSKYNEIDIGHLHIQKHASYKKCHKKYKYYVCKLTEKFSDTFHPTGKNI